MNLCRRLEEAIFELRLRMFLFLRESSGPLDRWAPLGLRDGAYQDKR